MRKEINKIIIETKKYQPKIGFKVKLIVKNYINFFNNQVQQKKKILTKSKG